MQVGKNYMLHSKWIEFTLKFKQKRRKKTVFLSIDITVNYNRMTCSWKHFSQPAFTFNGAKHAVHKRVNSSGIISLGFKTDHLFSFQNFSIFKLPTHVWIQHALKENKFKSFLPEVNSVECVAARLWKDSIRESESWKTLICIQSPCIHEK